MPTNVFDKWMWRIAYLYLVIPFIIFCIGWLKWLYSIPVAVVIIIALYFSLRQHRQFIAINFHKHRVSLFVCLALLLAWVFFSGIGQFSFQNGDHYARNAVLKDLVEQPWPLVYNFTTWQPYGITQPGEYMLVYYIGYWLPAALVGKIFGLAAAHFFLFLWTMLGVTLVFYFMCRLLLRIRIWMVLLLMLFGGMDVIPFLLKGNYSPTLHLEWWRNGFQQYTSNTSLLYWVFNQAIIPWLIMGMLLNGLPKKNIAFVSALCFFYAPFPFLGLIPFAIYFFFRNSTEGSFFKNLFSFQNTLAALIVMLLMIGYYSSTMAENNFNLYVRSFTSNLAFYCVEFLLVAIILFIRGEKKFLVLFIVIILILLSFVQYRHTPDLMMRASVPALFMLMLLSAEQLIKRKTKLNYFLICLLLIGSISSLNEINRSTYFTTKYWYAKNVRHTEPGFELLQKPDLFKSNNPVIVTVVGKKTGAFYRNFCKSR